MPYRRFSPPLDIDDNGACFIGRDHNGQALLTSISKKSPEGAPLPIYLPEMKLAGSHSTSPSCRNC